MIPPKSHLVGLLTGRPVCGWRIRGWSDFSPGACAREAKPQYDHVRSYRLFKRSHPESGSPEKLLPLEGVDRILGPIVLR